MRRTLMFTVLLASALAMPAFAGDAATIGNQRFGAPVVEKKATNLGKLARKPASFAGKTLRIEGVVKEVCQGRGCWVEVQDARGATFIAKSLDESVLLPKDCKGQRIVVQGVVKALPAKGEDHDHGADVPAHECPAPSYVLSTQGVELVANK
jgi:hypothetical protein